MHIAVEPEIPMLRVVGLPTPDVRIVRLSKTELATLSKAAALLHQIRATWKGNDNHPLDTDVAMAAYTMDDIIEGLGQIEIGYLAEGS